ncbi:uncharacterized protein LOC105845519 [Hydra vulgaris]|uniref:uncharacterized protein LOC105845519 n=1 Tax=Hydra vulgaris TaxID=6087 RepID=UPI00064179E0|nr:UPF0676 protein C1494.01 isoform X1 [Hydra vulgaris]
MNENIPLVDVSCLLKYSKCQFKNDDFIGDKEIQSLAKILFDSFSKWGFVYLTGHTIDQEEIDQTFKDAKTFFELENHIKEQFLRTNDQNFGYVPYKFETFEKDRPFDLKECFQFQSNFSPNSELLRNLCSSFVQSKFYKSCEQFTYLLLKLFALFLIPDDVDFFVSKHHLSDATRNPTTLRLLYYPSLPDHSCIASNQLRCGEHSDYGTITLLFQDNAGGLQVVSPSGNYIDVTPIPGSVVVNSADMIEIWSSGKLKSTRHRVVIPNCHEKARQSLAFFVHPDDDIRVFPLDGSKDFTSINPKEYLIKKFSETY